MKVNVKWMKRYCVTPDSRLGLTPARSRRASRFLSERRNLVCGSTPPLHVALRPCVCPGYHGNRFRHCGPAAALNRRSGGNQIRFGNFYKNKWLTVSSPTYNPTFIIFSLQTLRLIFPQLRCGRDTWDWKCDGLEGPLLRWIMTLQEIQHETLSHDRCYYMLPCWFYRLLNFLLNSEANSHLWVTASARLSCKATYNRPHKTRREAVARVAVGGH